MQYSKDEIKVLKKCFENCDERSWNYLINSFTPSRHGHFWEEKMKNICEICSSDEEE